MTPRVLVVGEALIDIVGGTEIVGGSPANVALGLGRLGLDVGLLTALGDDERGRRIESHLRASGVRVHPESFTLARTSTARATVGGDGSAEYEFDVDWRLPHAGVPGQELLHVGSLGCFLEPGASRVMDLVRDTTGAPTRLTFDPNIRPALVDPSMVRRRVEDIASVASAVKLSDEDAQLIYPGLRVDDVADRLLTLGPAIVAVTRGGEGALIATPRARARFRAPETRVVDTVGAGDTFMAAMIATLANAGTWDLAPAEMNALGEFCVTAAAITVGRAGADLPSRRDVEALCARATHAVPLDA